MKKRGRVIGFHFWGSGYDGDVYESDLTGLHGRARRKEFLSELRQARAGAKFDPKYSGVSPIFAKKGSR